MCPIGMHVVCNDAAWRATADLLTLIVYMQHPIWHGPLADASLWLPYRRRHIHGQWRRFRKVGRYPGCYSPGLTLAALASRAHVLAARGFSTCRHMFVSTDYWLCLHLKGCDSITAGPG